MLPSWRAVRPRFLTPDRAQARVDVRGFHVSGETTGPRLERVGESVPDGFRHALEATGPEAFAGRLESVDRPYRGFAYEGAAMAFAVLDGLSPCDGTRIGRILAGAAAPHVYMGRAARLHGIRRDRLGVRETATGPPANRARAGPAAAPARPGRATGSARRTSAPAGTCTAGRSTPIRAGRRAPRPATGGRWWTGASAGRCGSSPAPTPAPDDRAGLPPRPQRGVAVECGAPAPDGSTGGRRGLLSLATTLQHG
jgi:hypothetical protein